MNRLLYPFAAALLLTTAAQGGMFTYATGLSGPAQSPPVASPGTGFTTVIYDSTAHTLQVDVTFSGLLAGTTISHIHCCTLPNAGVATETPSFPGFPVGVTSGTYSQFFDLTLPASWNAAFITANGGTAAGAEAAFAAGLAAGDAYLNIHTTAFPGGEIRGFLASVPEPATGALTAFALAGLLLGRRAYSRFQTSAKK